MMAHPLIDIPELRDLDAGRGLVRIPMQRDIPFTPRVRALVDSAEFQRLRHVSQLGLVSAVYPGATHTRFEHALGVYHNALLYLWQLGCDTRFGDVVDPHTAEVLIVAALLHDLGHWPYCHPIEDLALPGLPSHEEFAAEFLNPQRELTQILRDEWNVQPEEILDVLVPRGDAPGVRLVRSILSGPVDIDKMDYLDRDSLHCGVPYGRNFDRNRLIHSLLVNEAGDGLAVSAKGRTAAELMVFARYVMFSEVYWHHAVRSATSMVARSFYDVHDQLEPRELFLCTEADMIRRMKQTAEGQPSGLLLDGVFGSRRSLHKRVAEYSLFQRSDLYQRLRGRSYNELVRCADHLCTLLAAELKMSIARTEILIDAPPCHREVEFKVDIYFPKEDVYRPLGVVSPVVHALATTQFDDYVKRVRVFAAGRVAESLRELVTFDRFVERAIDETIGQSPEREREREREPDQLGQER